MCFNAALKRRQTEEGQRNAMVKEIYRIKPFSFMLWWIACSIFVWPLAVVMLGLVLVPLTLALQYLMPDLYYSSTSTTLMGIFGVPLLGLTLGLTVAMLQRWLLRNKLYWAADGWRKWSLLGGAIGACIVYGITSMIDIMLPYPESEVWSPFVMMPVYVLSVSAAQWFALRNAVKQAWLWVFGNFVAGMVFSGLLSSYYDGDTNIGVLAMFALGVLAQGYITGYVLLFLFEKKLLPMSPAGHESDVQRPKSVWDEAI
jgi:hypothetical protein